MDAKLPPDDHARIVRRQVEQLDRSEVDRLYSGRGQEPYDPILLLQMVLYQHLKGRLSPASWEEEAKLNEAMQWLGHGYTPARRTWYDFRDRIGDVIERLHDDVTQRAIEQGHLDPTTVALDGTSIAACASRHRMVNRNTLQRRQELLKELIDGTYCRTDPLPKWVPPTESGRQDLASRIEAAAIVLEQRINENAKKPSDKRKDPDKITVSLTDPIAPLGRDKRKTYRPLYTVQFMVDPVSRLIVSYLCQASATDAGTLAPMIDKTQKLFGGQLKRVLADGGYCSILDLTDARDRNIDLLAPPSASGSAAKRKSRSGEIQIPREEFRFEASLNCYVCPQGHRLAYLWREKKMRMGDRYVYQSTYQCDAKFCEGCPLAERCLSGKGPRRIKRIEGEEMLEAQREKMASESCKTLYRLRGQTVELSFGDAKGNRRVDRFHGRGIERARCETGLLILAQNLLRLDKLQQRAISLGKQTA
ncbi:IS1182 family transposase [Novipirellula sp. SH528]|uniref:IS1182 family transposase n=1 Tax=Novipirellula sp. SH528 TaxID=3454466 RepID=UPI003FA0A380